MESEYDIQLKEYIGSLEEHAAKTGIKAFIKTNAGPFFMNSIFEAETVKGNKNYIVFFFVKNNYVYYCHGDRGKKVREDQFQKLIDYGDLVPVPREKADPEKLALSVLGLKAMSEGLPFNDYMKTLWGHGHGSEVR